MTNKEFEDKINNGGYEILKDTNFSVIGIRWTQKGLERIIFYKSDGKVLLEKYNIESKEEL